MKPFWKSKTILFNVFTGLVTLAGVLPPHWAALALAVGNLGLRYMTTEGITIL